MKTYKFEDLLKLSGFNLVNKHTSADGVVDNVFLISVMFDMFVDKYPCLLPSQDDLYSDPLTCICTDDTLLDLDDSVWRLFDNAPAYCAEDLFKRIRDILNTNRKPSVMMPQLPNQISFQKYDRMLNLGNAYLSEQWQYNAKKYGYKLREARERTLVATTEYKYYAVLANLLMTYDAINEYLKPLLGMPLVTVYTDDTTPFFTFRVSAAAYTKLQRVINEGKLQSYVLNLCNVIQYNIFNTNICALNKFIDNVISSVQGAYENDGDIITCAVHLYISAVLSGISSENIGFRTIRALTGGHEIVKED